MNNIFLHQYFLQIFECWVTTKFQSGPVLKCGNRNVQKAMSAASVGIIRRSLEAYSSRMLIFWVRCNLPINEYVVSRPDNMMNGSVYKLAARPRTVHGFPMYWNNWASYWLFLYLLNRKLSLIWFLFRARQIK